MRKYQTSDEGQSSYDEGSEYQPSESESSSDSSDTEEERFDTDRRAGDITGDTPKNNQPVKPENTDLHVADVNLKRSKYSYCVFCSKRQVKIPRHCKRFHSQELIVAEAMSVPK